MDSRLLACRRARLGLGFVTVVIGVSACASTTSEASDGGPRLVQPGAPGQPSRVLTDPDSAQAVIPQHTEQDVAFMQGMIAHHTQAVVMARLIPDRTSNPAILATGRRIDRSQVDEMALMSGWLEERGETVPSPALDESAFMEMQMGHGMLTRAEFDELNRARDEEFDRLFLQMMIRHHDGALTMVDELFDGGSGLEPTVAWFAGEVNMDQSIEISRMIRMLQEAR